MSIRIYIHNKIPLGFVGLLQRRWLQRRRLSGHQWLQGPQLLLFNCTRLLTMEQLGLRQQLAGSENDLPTVTQLKLLTCVAAAQTIRCSATPPSAHETGDHVGWARRRCFEIPACSLYRMCQKL